MCVCSLGYPACKAHAPNYHLWHARLCYIFPNYLIKGGIFGKKIIEHKIFLIICTNFVWNISYNKKKTHRYQFLLKSFVQCGRTDRQTYMMKVIAALAILRTRLKATDNDAPVLRWIKSRGIRSVYLILKFSKHFTKALGLTHWKLHDMKRCEGKGERGPGLLDHYLFEYITRQ